MTVSVTTAHSITRFQKRVVLFALLTFFTQAMYAQGTMAGSGGWVELCSADTGSLQLIYLGDQGNVLDHNGVLEHADEPDCGFSAGAFGPAHQIGQTLLGSATFTPEFYRSLELQASLYTRRLARAPPLALV